jgi:hypothetical protein
MSSSRQVGQIFEFLKGDGEAAQLVRDFDWGCTSLGPTGSWPQSLRSIIAFMIH